MHTSFDDLSLMLGEIALFRGLPLAVIAEVARASQVLSLPKGRVIYAAGDRPRGLYYVMSGHLKTVVSSPEGGEKVIEILSPRQVFGVAELFADAACVSTVETVTPVVVMAVGRDGVFRAMEQEPEVARRMLSAMAERQSSIERDIAADCFQSGSAKVVDYLVRLAVEHGCEAGQVELELEIPKHVLAARLGFTPETLSRIFRELSDAGMIHVHGKQVTLMEAFSRQHLARPGLRRSAAAAPRRAERSVGNWRDRASASGVTRMAAWG